MILVYTMLLLMKLLSLSGNINMAHLLPVPTGLTAISHTSERIATPMLVLLVSVVRDHAQAVLQMMKASNVKANLG
jgi:hypothetical protein